MANAHAPTSAKGRVDFIRDARKARFIDAKMRFERSAHASGSYAVGRDSEGKPVDTRTPLSLGMTINGWMVRTVFKRDDTAMLKGKDWREVEAEAKSGRLPIKLVVTENHIITAVRELKHVRDGYSREINATEQLVSQIMSLNDGVANKPHPIADERIQSVITGLKGLRPQVASKDSPLKHIVGLGRLDDAIRRFEGALSPDCRNRALELGRACAVLSSVPERLGAWRERRIAGGVAYTEQRESSLRVERDKWVFSQLARFTSNPARISGFLDEDGKRKEALNRISALLSELEGLHKPLRALRRADKWSGADETRLSTATLALDTMKAEAERAPWSNRENRATLKKEIYRLSRKKARNEDDERALVAARKALDDMKTEAMKLPYFERAVTAPLRIAIRKMKSKKTGAEGNAVRLVEAEKAYAEKKDELRKCIKANACLFGGPDAREHPTHVSGNYSWIYRNIREGRLNEARDKVEYLLLFLDSNKPRFILDELGKSPDSYLQPVLAELKIAVEALEAKDFKAAQSHFSKSALHMRGIVFP